MADFRTLLAAVLGIGLGALLLAYPGAAIRVHLAGRMPHDYGGEYGESAAAPERWRRVVQAVGVVLLLAGAYFGATVLAGW